MGLDRISHLPEDMLDRILSILPIKDATKTSLLSREWRHKYSRIQDLVFDDRSFALEEPAKVVRIVDHVLARHLEIQTFELSVTQKIPASEIERWIRFLSRMRVRALVLKVAVVRVVRMPSLMFSCQSLRRLVLTRCVLEPPSTFKGFENLMDVNLKNSVVKRDVLESLISGSPLLEKFIYRGDYADHYLRIEAPNLRHLGIITNSCHVSLVNTHQIQIFYMLRKENGNNPINVNHGKELLAGMPGLRRLSLGHDALKGTESGGFPVPLVYLRHLMIEVRLADVKGTSHLLSLLISTPSIQQLSIYFFESENLEGRRKGWKSDSLNRPFTNLRDIQIRYFRATKADMDFISFMLLNSLVLERMVIKMHAVSLNGREAVMKKLLSFRRGSQEARVIVVD